MLRDEYFRRLVEDSYIELYLSSNDGCRIYWPWRMQPPKEATDSYRNACEKYIIDSDPEDETVTTVDVLDCAERLGAEVASLQDVYQDKDATVDSILRGLEVADDHGFDGRLLIPLQKPYVDCFREIGSPNNHLIGIGGLKEAAPELRIEAAKKLRREVGDQLWIHGFGWGLTGGLDKCIRKNPGLLDSLDYSTPIQVAINKVEHCGGERMTVQAMQAATQLITDLRRVSPHVESENSKYLRETGQSSLPGSV